MSIFKVDDMTEDKALRMEKELSERLEYLKKAQENFEMFNVPSYGDFLVQIEETQKQLDILNTQYTEFLI